MMGKKVGLAVVRDAYAGGALVGSRGKCTSTRTYTGVRPRQ